MDLEFSVLSYIFWYCICHLLIIISDIFETEKYIVKTYWIREYWVFRNGDTKLNVALRNVAWCCLSYSEIIIENKVTLKHVYFKVLGKVCWRSWKDKGQ